MSRQWPHFPNAPIVEALLDIRVELPPDVGLEQLASLHDSIRSGYPVRREHSSWQGNVRVEAESVQFNKTGGKDGYLFSSEDGKQIVQARLNGFTFNRLKPYPSWDSFRREARDNWITFQKLVTPITVERLGLRFINAIEVPVGANFKEYVLTVPEIAPEVPQSLDEFLVRLVIPMESFSCKAIVTETMRPILDKKTNSIDKHRFHFILDIDVFRAGPYDPSSDDIWDAFDILRNATGRGKNNYQVFVVIHLLQG